MAPITLEKVTKVYPNGFKAADNFNLALIHRKIGRSGGQDRPSIREKCLPVRENGGCETNPCPLRKALFRCAHLRTARTGFR